MLLDIIEKVEVNGEYGISLEEDFRNVLRVIEQLCRLHSFCVYTKELLETVHMKYVNRIVGI